MYRIFFCFFCRNLAEKNHITWWMRAADTALAESTAMHLQFVRQYPPHLYRCTFLASKPWRKANPTAHLLFVLQYASHLYGNTFEKVLGVWVNGKTTDPKVFVSNSLWILAHKSPTLKTLTSLNKQAWPFSLSENSIWSFPLSFFL